MATRPYCPQCGGARVNLRTEKINLETGKPIKGPILAFVVLILGLLFSAVGGWMLVSEALNPLPGQLHSQVCYSGGMSLFIGFTLLSYGGRLIIQRRGERAESYTYHCIDCKYTWREWEEGAGVTKEMIRGWYLNDIRTEKGTPRQKAIRALGKLGDESDVGTLTGILKETGFTSLPDRLAAAEALGNIDSPDAMEALVRVLDDKNLAETAARSLGMLGNPIALEALEKATQGKNKRVCIAAQEAIDEIREGYPEPVS
jgi:hypothetical protein